MKRHMRRQSFMVIGMPRARQFKITRPRLDHRTLLLAQNKVEARAIAPLSLSFRSLDAIPQLPNKLKRKLQLTVAGCRATDRVERTYLQATRIPECRSRNG